MQLFNNLLDLGVLFLVPAPICAFISAPSHTYAAPLTYPASHPLVNYFSLYSDSLFLMELYFLFPSFRLLCTRRIHFFYLPRPVYAYFFFAILLYLFTHRTAPAVR